VFVALLAFLLGDLFRSGGSKFFGDPNVVGSVNGRDITRLELSEGMDELKSANPEQYANMTSVQLASFVWNTIVTDEVLAAELEASGMSVSPEEIYLDIINNPNIRQSFSQNGQFDENMFKSYLSQIRESRDATPESAEMWAQWLIFENAVKGQSKNFKFTNAVQKALFIPEGLAKVQLDRNQTTYPAQYVYVPYISVNEDEIEVGEKEAKRYYNAHKDEFTQEEGRNIEYVNFPLVPSQADRDAVQAELATLAIEWMNAEDDSVFVNLNSDIRFNGTYVTIDRLVGSGIDTLVEGQDPGYIKGPLDLGGAFAVVKLVDTKQIPDSVEARHILVPYAGAQGATADALPGVVAKELADSLFNHLKANPSDWNKINEAYSSDQLAREKDGDLGYFSRGQMVPAFDNYCFYNKTGSMGVVATQFGFHIIDITNQKGSNTAYKIGQIVREILPSDETIQNLYSQASGFAGMAQGSEDYRALASESQLTLLPARNLGQFDEMIPGLGASRRIVRWAWDQDRKVGNIGLIENDGKGYVVVVLTDKLEAGTTPYELVATQCLAGAKLEAKKAIVKERIQTAKKSASTIDELAGALEVKVGSLSFRPNSSSIPGVGSEPKVVGQICSQEADKMGEILEGKNGMFVAKTAAAVASSATYDAKGQAMDTQTSIRNLVSSQAYKALEDKAVIEDNRHLMF
jgi:parvulin-like peptidyl-prolyl isomerase